MQTHNTKGGSEGVKNKGTGPGAGGPGGIETTGAATAARGEVSPDAIPGAGAGEGIETTTGPAGAGHGGEVGRLLTLAGGSWAARQWGEVTPDPAGDSAIDRAARRESARAARRADAPRPDKLGGAAGRAARGLSGRRGWMWDAKQLQCSELEEASAAAVAAVVAAHAGAWPAVAGEAAEILAAGRAAAAGAGDPLAVADYTRALYLVGWRAAADSLQNQGWTGRDSGTPLSVSLDAAALQVEAAGLREWAAGGHQWSLAEHEASAARERRAARSSWLRWAAGVLTRAAGRGALAAAAVRSRLRVLAGISRGLSFGDAAQAAGFDSTRGAAESMRRGRVWESLREAWCDSPEIRRLAAEVRAARAARRAARPAFVMGGGWAARGMVVDRWTQARERVARSRFLLRERRRGAAHEFAALSAGWRSGAAR